MCKISRKKSNPFFFRFHFIANPIHIAARSRRVAWRLGWALFALFLVAPAHADTLPDSVNLALQTARIPPSHVAILVQELTQAQPLLTLNDVQAMNPASVMKLLTTFAALDTLGPNFRWETEVLRRGSLRHAVLHGDLIFKGKGDPKITLQDFWLMLRDLRRRGLQDIRGNLILDRSYFDVPEENLGAFDGAPYKPYNLSPDALLLDFRSQRLHIFLDGPNGTPRLLMEPALPATRLVNQLHSVAGECGDWKEKIQFQREGATLRFFGDYPQECGEQTLNLILQNKDDYFAENFRALWAELGGRWRGSVRAGTTPADAQLIASYASSPLLEAIRDINKYSNNVMARQLFLTLGAQLRGIPASPEKSAAAINDWVGSKGQNFLELVLENGSGLSRSERISAQHLGWLLRTAYRSNYAAEFISTLPILALDGTLKKRMLGENIAGHAHIKTGSLKDVRAIAGYVRDARGRDVVVVFLINDDHADAGRAAQDALLDWVFNRP